MKVNHLCIDGIIDLDTDKLASNSIEDNYSCNFLYLLFDNKQLVYVGQSMHYPSNRISAHLGGDKVFNRFSVINLGGEYDKNFLSGAEATLIIFKRPRYNKSIPNNTKWVRKGKLSTILGIHPQTLKKKLKDINIKTHYTYFNYTKYFDVESLRKALL